MNISICKVLINSQLEQQVEAEELSNSVLLEISKSSVVSWREKLKTKYGWFKTDNCKNIIFEVRETRLLTTDGTAGLVTRMKDKFISQTLHVSASYFPAYDAQNVKIAQHLLITFF